MLQKHAWSSDHIGESEASIPGYNCIRCDRNRHGGGVALLISDKLEYKVTLCEPKEMLVSVFSTNNVNEKVYIGLWYWPPSNSGALDNLYSTFESLDISIFSSFILLGDFNIDFCNHHHPLFSKFLQSFVLTQVVPWPTHFNSSSSSTHIDLVLLSVPVQLVNCMQCNPVTE